jgi:YVTN family beta-propeller protein
MKVGRTHIGIASLLASASRISATAFMAVVVFTVVCFIGSAQGLAQKAYIPEAGANDVSVIDTTTNTVTGTIMGSFLNEPEGVVVSRDGKKAYVTNYFSDSVSVIDTATNTIIANINLGFQTFPIGVAVRPDGSRVYVAENATNLP